MQFAKWIFIDNAQDKGAAGCYVPNSTTMAQVIAFSTVLQGFSDGERYKETLAGENNPAYDTANCGEHEVERRGTVVIQQQSTKQIFRIAIPAISQANIDKQGSAPAKVLAATEEAVLAAFAIMTGITASDLRVVRSEVRQGKH